MRQIVIGVRNRNARLAQDVDRLKRENALIKAHEAEFQAMRTHLDEALDRLLAYEAYLRTHSLLTPAQLYAERYAEQRRKAEKRAETPRKAPKTHPVETEVTP